MGKHRNRTWNQNDKQRTMNSDEEINTIRREQQRQHQTVQRNTDRHSKPLPKKQVIVLLENGVSFSGIAIVFNHPGTHCKIIFKGQDRRELRFDADSDIQSNDPAKTSVLQSIINNYLITLHEEAVMEFPAWLEKHSTRIDENNPFFNLDEIREEFKFKKFRFGTWRTAAQLGFFDDLRPQFAKFNKIMRIELQEIDPIPDRDD